MKYYLEPVSLDGDWNLFKHYERIGNSDTYHATKEMKKGETLLIYIGKQVKSVESGVYAIATITSDPYYGVDEEYDPNVNRWRVWARIDYINFTKPIINSNEIKRFTLGYRAPHKITNQLNELEKMVESYLSHNISVSEEIQDKQNEYFEGSKKQITVNAYERDQSAKLDCLKYHGTNCKICGFNSEKLYGESFKHKIHVHHIKPLNEIGEKYRVNPVRDLIPVCPNCHMILHSKKPAYSPDEVKLMLNKSI